MSKKQNESKSSHNLNGAKDILIKIAIGVILGFIYKFFERLGILPNGRHK